MGQDANFGSSGPTHPLVIRSFITIFHLNPDNTPTPGQDHRQQKGTVNEAESLLILIWVKVPHKKVFICLKKNLLLIIVLQLVKVLQLPQQLTVSSQFTKLFLNDSLISSFFMDHKTFTNGMAGRRPLHLESRSRSLTHLVLIMKYWNTAT